MKDYFKEYKNFSKNFGETPWLDVSITIDEDNCELLGDLFPDRDESYDLTDNDELKSLYLKVNSECKDDDLTPYLPEGLKSKVDKIIFCPSYQTVDWIRDESVEILYYVKLKEGVVVSRRDLTDLAEFIRAQLTDGWGEGEVQSELMGWFMNNPEPNNFYDWLLHADHDDIYDMVEEAKVVSGDHDGSVIDLFPLE